jgi:hypothetical protein
MSIYKVNYQVLLSCNNTAELVCEFKKKTDYVVQVSVRLDSQILICNDVLGVDEINGLCHAILFFRECVAGIESRGDWSIVDDRFSEDERPYHSWTTE